MSNPTFAQFLARAYDAHVFATEDMAALQALFAGQYPGDAVLQAAAQARLAQLDALAASVGESDLAQRDFCSAVQRKFIREALGL